MPNIDELLKDLFSEPEPITISETELEDVSCKVIAKIAHESKDPSKIIRLGALITAGLSIELFHGRKGDKNARK